MVADNPGICIVTLTTTRMWERQRCTKSNISLQAASRIG